MFDVDSTLFLAILPIYIRQLQYMYLTTQSLSQCSIHPSPRNLTDFHSVGVEMKTSPRHIFLPEFHGVLIHELNTIRVSYASNLN